MKSLTLATLALLSTLPGAAWAQPASMLLDLGHEVSFASPLGEFDRTGREPVELDGALYFLANDSVHGFELWRTDGTPAGTRILQDTCPGICGSFPGSFTAFRHKMYWTASDGLHSLLLASDGTPQGTGPAFGPGAPVASHSLAPLGEIGGRLLLSGLSADGSKGELWATDGTTAGLARLGSFRLPESPSAARPSLLGRIGGVLIFGIGSQTQRESLWATDGTAAGTVQINAGASGVSFTGHAFASPLVVLGSRLFFEASGLTGGEAWVSDGTAAGTHPLAGVDAGVAAVGSQLFFFRTTSGGRQLWKSDSTLAGATLVKDFSGLTDENISGGLFAAGSRLFFWGSRNLWVSDGTEAGTRPVREISGFPGFFEFAAGDRLGFFVSDGFPNYRPWVSDGSAAGTHEVAADVQLGSDRFSGMGVLGGRWLFDSRDSQGWFLWASDGSPGNLTKVAPLDLQTSPFLSPLADLNGTMFFFSGVPGTGGAADLWRSDGSASGTSQVERVVPVRGFDGTIPPAPLAVIGDRLFFSYDFALWETDGTAAGTLTVPATSNLTLYGDPVAKIGGSLYFVTSGFPYNFVKTDGTDAGTAILRASSGNESLTPPIAVDNRLFFGVTNFQPSRTALWTSDGTAAGTKPVATTHVFQNPTLWGALGSRLLFAETGAAGIELWASDGTAAGTRRLSRIAALKPGRQPDYNLYGAPAGSLAFAAGRIFFAGDDGVHGRELWVSDGTPGGTRMLADIARGASGSSIGSFAAVGGRVFFAAHEGVHGRELWVTNGTAAGTRLVADIVPGARSSYLGNLAGAGGLLLFSADDGVHGQEPWVSDGTKAGTRMLQDIAPGPLPSNLSGFFLSGHEVYFTANDATHGFEIWSMPLEALTQSP